MNCGICGKKLETSGRFCIDCGNKPITSYCTGKSTKPNKIQNLDNEIEDLKERLRAIEELLAL